MRRLPVSPAGKESCMRKHRLVCLLLGVIFALGMLPATAYAGSNEIASAEISGLEIPAFGVTPDFKVTVPEGAPYHLATREEMLAVGYTEEGLKDIHGSVAWTAQTEDYTMRMPRWEQFLNLNNESYWAAVYLVADSGYTFKDDVWSRAKINGDADLVDQDATMTNGTMLILATKNFKVTPPEGLPAMVTVTVDANGGIKGTEFKETEKLPIGIVITWSEPTDEYLKAPEGKRFAGMEIDGMFYPKDAYYSFVKDVTVKNIWDSPDDPYDPDNPDIPDEPEKPDKPDEPDEPDQPEKPEKPAGPEAPATGDESLLPVWAGIGAAALAAAVCVVIAIRKKNRAR